MATAATRRPSGETHILALANTRRHDQPRRIILWQCWGSSSNQVVRLKYVNYNQNSCYSPLVWSRSRHSVRMQLLRCRNQSWRMGGSHNNVHRRKAMSHWHIHLPAAKNADCQIAGLCCNLDSPPLLRSEKPIRMHWSSWDWHHEKPRPISRSS